MQVHPWAKRVTGLGNVNKIHLHQTQFSPVNLEFASGTWVGFGAGVIGSYVP